MNYYHVLWTRPYFKPGTSSSGDIVLWDFELLVWLLSLLQARQFGPICLLTDSRGAEAAERAGLVSFYTGGIRTDLDCVPNALDQEVFWAGGKLYAYGLMDTPCASIDLDAVLWKPLTPSGMAMALHREDRDWPWYSDNRHKYAKFGFENGGWNWDLDPFNTGIIYLGDRQLARDYSRTACAFMERFSQQACTSSEARAQNGDAMLFAEQRLLPMCAMRHNLSVLPLLPTLPFASCLPHNSECLHLWRSKLAYKLCVDARRALVNWSIEHLQKHFPDSCRVLARWNLDHPHKEIREGPIDPAEFAQVHQGDLRFSLIKHVTGNISIQDLTTGITRKASEGCMVWSGEVIHPEPGAELMLEVIGMESLRIKATG